MWTRLFSTAVIPVILLLYLNSRIILDLATNKVQRFGSVRRQRKEFNLCLILLCIVLIFFLCHSTRIMVDIVEFSMVENIIECQPWYPDPWVLILDSASHLMMVINR